MKNLLGIFIMIASMALFLASCSKTGCPSVANYDEPLSKDLKVETIAKLTTDDIANMN